MIYLAGPWFTVRQSVILEAVKLILQRFDLQVYSPKDEMLFKEGGSFSPEEIYKSNIVSIQAADLMIVITDGKDIGTIFEAGYAAREGVPIIYLWVDHDDSNFNIMLAQSGNACYLGLGQFEEAMEHYSKTKQILSSDYKGKLE